MKTVSLSLLFLLFIQINSFSQIAFDYPPLNYSTAILDNDIEELQKQLNEGKLDLNFEDKHGYLPAILKALKISQNSQVLVFSKTSFQTEKISADTPRALYFNESSYVGKVNGSNVLEFCAIDPNVGAVFYTLDQKKDETPKFVRNNNDCLDCHSSVRTQSVPGILIRSIFLDKNDSLKTSVVNHRTPLNERWGSWYVTGNSGSLKHLGNIVNSKGQSQKHQNINSLKNFINTEDYLKDQSDIVALMVLEHQSHMTNLITRTNFRTRITLNRQAQINKRENHPPEFISEYALEEIKSNCESVVRYMFFSGEAVLGERISGNEMFVDDFYRNTLKDPKGRFLKKLNCKTRLFEYPLSYMIYSNHFNSLPAISKEIIYKRVFDILTGKDKSDQYNHLTQEMRLEILEIVKETKKDLPAYWNQ